MIRRKNHTVYVSNLNLLIDMIFEEAYRQKYTWAALAKASGLSVSTVRNLGERTTLYPQYRTVELLAHAIGGEVKFNSKITKGKKFHATWKPKVFAA